MKTCTRGLHQYEGKRCLECQRASGLACRKANPEKERDRKRAWQKASPEKQRARIHRRRALKRAAAIEPFTPAQWQQVIDFYEGRCVYCDTGLYEHQDHVIPLARGGAHALYNIVPACSRCNLTKHVQIWTPRVEHPWMYANQEQS